MSDIAIKVRGLGKKYYIGEKLPQRSLAGSIKNAAGFPWKVAKSLIAGKAIDQREEFWALKDVAFDVKQGEVLGIIGRNGAGKSTLLKILSRITTPTEGEVELFGRVGCLLEVGTGFHPELTGRENVFLNGSLLGMSNVEIKQRFDEIVDFSGVERFLDTPVKFYSSGMYTRLAFSVAAHLNPEILIVDEVLAVGDAEFQKKCLGKMDDIAKSGRTILFVSHNMQAILHLCNKCLLLAEGQMKLIDETAIAINSYLENTNSSMVLEKLFPDPPDSSIWIKRVSIYQKRGQDQVMEWNNPIEICMEYYIKQKVKGINFFINIYKHMQEVLTSYDVDEQTELLGERAPGNYTATFRLPGKTLKPGIYHLRIGAGIINVRAIVAHEECLVFELENTITAITSHSIKYTDSNINIPVKWQIIRQD